MHAHVGDVRRHALKGELARAVGVALLAGRIELEETRAVTEAFGPLGPAACGVLARGGEDGGTLGGIVFLEDQVDLLAGKLPKAAEGRGEVGGFELVVDAHGKKK